MTEEQARKQLTDASYFGTMLVVLGYADGLVSGSVNSTANTVRPALQVIKTKPGQKLVSGAFLMCFKDHVAVFSDCAINLNPDAERLSEIALQSAETTCLRHRPEGRYALLLHPRLRQGTGRGHGRGKPPSCSKEKARICRWSVPSSSTPPGPHRSRHQGQGNDVAGPSTCSSSRTLVRRQHRLQSRAALLRRLGHRPGAAESQQAGKRPVRGALVRDIISTTHRPHRHRSAVSPRSSRWLPPAGHRNAFCSKQR